MASRILSRVSRSVPASLFTPSKSVPARAFATTFHQPGTKVTTLPNGLRVATEEGHGETATVGVWIDAGSAYESEANNGVAHFLEHMAFKGTQRRTQQQLELEVENMGASLNAYTSREQTVYYARSFKNDVPKAVDILSDILQNSQLSDANIERERNTILTELKTVESSTEEVIFDYLHSAAYQGTPLGRTILGPRSNIESISRSDLTNYISTHYTAPRMVLAASGAVKHEELVELAKKSFASLPAHEKHSFDHLPEFTGSEIRVRNDELPLAHIALAVESVGWNHPDFYTLQVLQTLLGNWDHTIGAGNNLSSRLAEIVSTNHLGHSISTFQTCYNNTGLFGNYLVTEAKHVEDLIAITITEWQRLANGATSAEVERAKAKLTASLLMALDGTTAITEEIGRQMISLDRRVPAAEVAQRIQEVTASDVRRVARERLTDISPAVVAIGPIEGLPDYNQIRGWTYWNRM
eukprot:TRINITY_DN836_c0_g1_i1.p1 TRINITY_DN836_c0_g1~~TRINITY_DN836_c0_g1_i1.p1  ORF type:complete len:468 (-),score=135.81 TRINITY_DN836_c0_g1_i1:44-1447(-)